MASSMTGSVLGAASEGELLRQLGLGPSSSNEQVESAHDEIVDFLAAAPDTLRAWAETRIDRCDEAYAQLSGSAAAPPSLSRSSASESRTAGPRRAQVLRGDGLDRDRLDGELVDASSDEIEMAEAQDAPRETPRRTRPSTRARRNPLRAKARAQNGAPAVHGVALRKTALVTVGLVGAIAVAMVVFNLGSGSFGPGSDTRSPQASGGLDVAAVSADMRKLADNPNDTTTLQDLANLYHAAEDYPAAQGWLQKILDIDPKNITALLAYGAAAFNLGDVPTAEAKWQAVLAIDPNEVEAHYDLGFVYLNSTPPNTAAARTHWNAVLALNPSTELKGFVETHLASLGRLESSQPGASRSPTASPTPGSGAPASEAGSSTAPADPSPSGR